MISTAKRLKSIQEYYFSIKLREVRGLVAAGKPIINMGIGSPDLAPSPKVLEAITQSLSEDNAHKYQSYQGLPEFREAVANFYAKFYNAVINPESEVLPLMGSKEGIMHISLAFLNKGDEVLIPNPGYPTYTSVTKLVEANPVFYDLDATNNWQPNFEKLEKLDLSKVKIMWVNYPHMPTGANAQQETFEKLIAFGKKHHIIIVNDNPYSFVLNHSPQSILAIDGANETALELNSLSKSFNMAGWRVGMLLGNERYLNEVLKVKTQMDSGMFYGIQKGAISALNLENSWFVEMNKIYQKRRELIWELALKLDCTFDSTASGMFVWAKLSTKKYGNQSAEKVVDDLLYDKNIFIAPGTIFGTKGEGYIRFSLCISEEKIKEAIARI